MFGGLIDFCGLLIVQFGFGVVVVVVLLGVCLGLLCWVCLRAVFG